jgi:hypothetical protein
MKSPEWKTYRTRFLVKAKQLTSTLSFTDHLGRQHCGRRGDYLVESYDGVLSIAPRRIFEDIYVAMTGCDISLSDSKAAKKESKDDSPIESRPVESLNIERIKRQTLRPAFNPSRQLKHEPNIRVARKSPQSVRTRTPSQIGLL